MPTIPTSPKSKALSVPYAQVSVQELSLGLLYAQDELQEHLPKLGWATWANALLVVQPNLWVGHDNVYIDEEDLTRLAQRLAVSPEALDSESLLHGSRAVYLGKRLVNYQDEAIDALADIEAHPLAYGLQVYRLVTGLATGNAVAQEVYRATQRGLRGRPGGADPELARAAVYDRLEALRTARGAFG